MLNKEKLAADLTAIREKSPLVHNITNYVAMNFTANALLAVGASPVMAHAVEEMEDMTAIAGALMINIGTLDKQWVEGMLAASINTQYDDYSAAIGSNQPYATIHQFGGNAGKNKKVIMYK